MPSRQSMQGRRVLITGGARGIGLETGRALAARGARVALIDLEADVLEQAAAGITGARWFVADVTDQTALQAATDATADALGGIDVVLASAGIAAPGPLRLADPVAFEKTLDVNVKGVFRTLHTAMPQLVDSRGYALAIASSAAVLHAPGLGAYATSKAAVEAMCNVLRVEVAHLGVGIGCGYFTFLDTEMVRGARASSLFTVVDEATPRFLARTYPVSLGVKAIVRGIENRSRIVVAPRFVRPAIALRTLLTRVAERDMLKLAPVIDERFAAEIEERGLGDASRPVGAGGAAATRQ